MYGLHAPYTVVYAITTGENTQIEERNNPMIMKASLILFLDSKLQF